MTIRILIADDHGVLRAGLSALLSAEPGFEVVGEAGSGEEAIELALSLQPDVVLMDISMPTCGGIEATRRILARRPEMRILMLTVHEDKSMLRESIQAGAAGYILKRAVKTELINALHAVSSGDLYVHPALTRALLTDMVTPSAESPKLVEELTPRELDVLRLIAQGYTNTQIASVLNLSVRTIEYHRSNLMGKLQLNSRVDLVRYATKHHLIDDDNRHGPA